MKRGILFLVVFIFLIGLVSAVDLYVDQNSINGACSDSYTRATNDLTHPWCTIARANDQHIGGDHVYILPGEYRERSYCYTSSDDVDRYSIICMKEGISESERTVYSGYGAREDVKLVGSKNISSTSWTLESGNIYRAQYTPAEEYTVGIYPISCFEDRRVWYSPRLSLAEVNQPGEFYYNDLTDTIYLWAWTSTPGDHLVECTDTPVVTGIKYVDNLVIQNLTILQPLGRGVSMNDAHNITIQNNEFAFTGGLEYPNENPAAVFHGGFCDIPCIENIQIIGNYIHDVGSNHGPSIEYEGEEGATFTGPWGHSGQGIQFYSVAKGLVANNTIYNVSYGVYLKNYNSNILIENNTIYNSYLGVFVKNGNVRNTVQENTIFNIGSYGIALGTPVVDGPPSDDNIFRQNTVYNIDDAGIYLHPHGSAHGGNPSLRSIIQNNLVESNDKFISVTQAEVSESNYNFFDNSRSTPSFYWDPSTYDFLGWQINTGFDLNSIEADPQFISTDPASPDFLRPSVGSPAIDAGTIIPGYHCTESGVESEPGCKVWYGSAPDIGAFEYLDLGPVNECDDWQTNHPEWIWCDDFEDATAISNKYFEYNDDAGDFVNTAGVGVDGSSGMSVLWQEDETDAGYLHKTFGRLPSSYFETNAERTTEDFYDVYWRMYVKMEDGWTGGHPAKLSRAFSFADSNWAQAMIAHNWGADPDYLTLDPASGIDNETGNLVTTTYNDFENLNWLGMDNGVTPLFSTENSGKWFCVEAHAKYNDPGSLNGIFEFWIDDNLEASINDLDWVNTWRDYGINAVYFENYWNDGSPVEQSRYFDNIVISTERIGCLDSEPEQNSPDVNSDGSVNIIDLALTIYWQGKIDSDGDWSWYDHLDVNSDGSVNWGDVLEVLKSI